MLRYLIRGLTDGSLSTLGIVIGAYNPNLLIILSAGIAGSIANGFSNILAAFSAEQAVGYRAFREIEEAMVTKLEGTKIEERVKKKIRKSCVFDGIATVIGGLIPITPFLLFSGLLALEISIISVITLIFFLGIFIGKLSKQNLLLSAGKMALFAILTASICILVQRLI